MKAHGYWPPSALGLDPGQGYSEELPVPTWDPDTGQFVPGEGGGGGDTLVVYADEPPADAEPGTIYLSRRGTFFNRNGDPI